MSLVRRYEHGGEIFFHSQTYKALQNTENALWAESAGYIADCYYEEQEKNKAQDL